MEVTHFQIIKEPPIFRNSETKKIHKSCNSSSAIQKQKKTARRFSTFERRKKSDTLLSLDYGHPNNRHCRAFFLTGKIAAKLGKIAMLELFEFELDHWKIDNRTPPKFRLNADIGHSPDGFLREHCRKIGRLAYFPLVN